MSKYVLAAAILHGGVWTPADRIEHPRVYFETQTACEALRDARNWLGRNAFLRHECVAVGARHSLLPTDPPVTAKPPREE
ncbi:MAG: hypothetical protein QNJ84_02135 [Alphaproteobacteria bacterium]|nr:hypothetical protein [Alphaproteobacteria bacterium]